MSGTHDLEWLLTLGHGGYLSGTVSGIMSRSYHGLLIAQLSGCSQRLRLLSHQDEILVFAAGERVELACHAYRHQVLHPRGDLLQSQFEYAEIVRWTFTGDTWQLTKTLKALRGENGLAIEYQLKSKVPCQLVLRPFWDTKNEHGEEILGPWKLESNKGLSPETILAATNTINNQKFALTARAQGEFRKAPQDYQAFSLAWEKQRGLNDLWDLHSPGEIYLNWLPLNQQSSQLSIQEARIEYHAHWLPQDARSSKVEVFPLPAVESQLININDSQPLTSKNGTDNLRVRAQRLGFAVANAIIKKQAQDAFDLTAGYHWFNEWSRDAMIAIPGVTLACGKAVAIEILLNWRRRLKKGLFPNRLSLGGAAERDNSIDAPLWYLRAVIFVIEQAEGKERLPKTEQTQALVELESGAREILVAYLSGDCGHSARIDPSDGLFAAGDTDTQLTWMDAIAKDRPVTPRHGKCVELNSLLYLGLDYFGRRWQDLKLQAQAQKIQANFAKVFYDSDRGFLRDCVGPSDAAALRCNQAIALACAPSLLSAEQRLSVLKCLEEDLLTNRGLRTLSADHQMYQGRYLGGPDQRDAAYHQGCVWAWLIEFYVEAKLAAVAEQEGEVKKLAALCFDMAGDLNQQGLGFIGEIFEGDPPHEPRGTIAQTWSATGLYRAIHLLSDALGTPL